MSRKNLNPVNPPTPKRVAIVLSHPAVSTTTRWPVGFWWSELTHPYFRFAEIGYEVDIYSRVGGRCGTDAIDPDDDAGRPNTSSAAASSTTRTS
jgi:putative intracellular protease/amidase